MLVTALPNSAAHGTVFAHSKTMTDLLSAFSGTLERLGGAPEAMVVDPDISIVVPRSRPARLHTEVAALFGAFWIRPVILGARSPESKGRAERTVGYLERSFLPWRVFDGISDLQAQHETWPVRWRGVVTTAGWGQSWGRLGRGTGLPRCVPGSVSRC